MNSVFLTSNLLAWIYILSEPRGPGPPGPVHPVVGWTGPGGNKAALLCPGAAFISDVTAEPPCRSHEKHLQTH